jgi:hypothetical protein
MRRINQSFLFFIIGFLALAVSVFAAEFRVDSNIDLIDSNPGDNVCATISSTCTLRAAVQEANALSGTDTIIIPAGIYNLSIPGKGEDLNETGDLDITDDLSITGSHADETIIDGSGLDRVFQVFESSNVAICCVTIRNGRTFDGEHGGGIFSQGTLTINNSTISGNLADKRGGAIFNDSGILELNASTISISLLFRCIS